MEKADKMGARDPKDGMAQAASERFVLLPEEAQWLAWRALKYNDPKRLARMLAAGASPHALTDDETPSTQGRPVDMLCHACCILGDSSECLRALIDAGARVNAPAETMGPLHYLLGAHNAPSDATEGMAAAIAILVAAGADPNAKEEHLDSPLRLALYNLRGPFKAQVIEALLSCGARFELSGGSELDLAMKGSRGLPHIDDQEPALRTLIAFGASADPDGSFQPHWLLGRARRSAPACESLLASHFEKMAIETATSAAAEPGSKPRL